MMATQIILSYLDFGGGNKRTQVSFTELFGINSKNRCLIKMENELDLTKIK